MRILLVTPLYPPDIAGPAPYVKELANRLRGTHGVTILAYGHLPETIPDVETVTVEKRLPALVRMALFTWKLIMLQRNADIVYVQNGPSAEVPFALASFFSPVRRVLRLGDAVALTHTVHRRLFHRTLLTAMHRAQTLIIPKTTVPVVEALIATPTLAKKCVRIPSPDVRPEIHPLHEYPKDSFAQYEASWQEHITALLTCITSRT